MDAMFNFFSNTKQKKSFAIACSGLGLGNASRILAIIEELEEKYPDTYNFTIYTWGNAFVFFEKYFSSRQTVQLKSLYDLRGPLLPFAFILNHFILFKYFIKNKHKFVLIDSDYHFVIYLILRLKIYSISQASDVIKRAIKLNYSPKSIKEFLAFFFREKVDALIQSVFSTHVFIPTFIGPYLVENKLIQVPLIVRKEFNKHPMTNHHVNNITTILSGSGIESEKFESLNIQSLIISKKKALYISQPNVFDESKLLIIQGGLSTISECIARKKPMIVFPITNHFEQMINALTIKDMNLGTIGEWEKIDKSIEEAQQCLELKNNNFEKIRTDGAAFIAKELIKAINSEI